MSYDRARQIAEIEAALGLPLPDTARRSLEANLTACVSPCLQWLI